MIEIISQTGWWTTLRKIDGTKTDWLHCILSGIKMNSRFDGIKNCLLVSDIIPISCLSELIKAHAVFIIIIFPKIFHWGDQNYTLKWIKLGNDMKSDITNGPSNWELVKERQALVWLLTLVFDLDSCLWVIPFDDPWLVCQMVSS